MAFILFSVAGLACTLFPDDAICSANFTNRLPPVVRFVGSTVYMIIRLFSGE